MFPRERVPLYPVFAHEGSLEIVAVAPQNARLLEPENHMDYFGWIVFAGFLSAAAYLLYAAEKGKSWALRYVQTLASISPEARRFLKPPLSSRAPLEENVHYQRYINEPWWIYL